MRMSITRCADADADGNACLCGRSGGDRKAAQHGGAKSEFYQFLHGLSSLSSAPKRHIAN
jgi:hypothetical protein